MSPLDRRRRRRRRILGARPRSLLVLALVGLVVVLLVIGGVAKVGAGSTSYRRAVDRSYAAQARVVVSQSAQVDDQLRSLLSTMPDDSRRALQAGLDTLVRAGDDMARSAGTADSPSPSDGVGASVAAAFGQRSEALGDLRHTIDGLLGMAPLPVAGTPATTVDSVAAPLSTAEAAAGLGRVGSLLEAADRSYASARRALRRAPGGASLPPSTWVPNPAAWSPPATQAMVGALVAGPRLAVVHRVVLLAGDLGLEPAAIPAAGGATSSVVPPTHRLSITAVVADEGDVAEPGVVVRAEAQPVAGGSAPEEARTVSLAAGGSTALALPALRVTPGASYAVTVTLTPPAGEVAGATTTDTFDVAVAPPSPPVVLAIGPRTGRSAGGTAVTIVGTGFTSVSAVSFGTVPARFVVTSTSQLTATAPPGSGTVTVTVTNPGGTSSTSAADGFTYRRRATGRG